MKFRSRLVKFQFISNNFYDQPEVLAHPVFAEATSTKLITLNHQNREEDDPMPRYKYGFVEYPTPEAKLHSLYLASQMLGNSYDNFQSKMMIPFGLKCKGMNPKNFTLLYPHGPFDILVIDQLKPDVTIDDIKDCGLKGLEEVYLWPAERKFVNIHTQTSGTQFGRLVFDGVHNSKAALDSIIKLIKNQDELFGGCFVKNAFYHKYAFVGRNYDKVQQELEDAENRYA